MIVEEYIAEGLRILVEQARQSHIRHGYPCSGRWLATIHTERAKNSLSIKALDYTRWLVFGSKPSKFPPYAAIREWVDCKPIFSHLSEKEKERVTWAVMYSIWKKGTQRYRQAQEGMPSFLDEAFNMENILDAFENLPDAVFETPIEIFRLL